MTDITNERREADIYITKRIIVAAAVLEYTRTSDDVKLSRHRQHLHQLIHASVAPVHEPAAAVAATTDTHTHIGKGKARDTRYSATYMSQTRDQQRCTISEVAADRHKPMVPQRIMWPSTARANGQLDPRCN